MFKLLSGHSNFKAFNEYKLYMNNLLLELLLKMMSNQSPISQGGNNFSQNNPPQTNPAYANYPQEAFIQATNNQNQFANNDNANKNHNSSNNNFNFQNENNSNNNFNNTNLNNYSNINNFINSNASSNTGSTDNNLFPLLMSLLNKNGNGLSSILELLSHKENHSTSDKSKSKSQNLDDDVLL